MKGVSRRPWLLFGCLAVLALFVSAGLLASVRLGAAARRDEGMFHENITAQSNSLNRVVFAVSRLLALQAPPGGDGAGLPDGWPEQLREVIGHAGIPSGLGPELVGAILEDDPLLLRARIPEIEASYAEQLRALLELYDQALAARDDGAAREVFDRARAQALGFQSVLARRSAALAQLESAFFSRLLANYRRDRRATAGIAVTLSAALLLAGAALAVMLRSSAREVRTLRGLIPICAHCKKVRQDSGYWQHVEQYVSEHSEARFSHGMCPACIRELYPDFADAAETDDPARDARR